MLNHSDIFLGILSTHGKGTSCACRSASLASDSVTATLGENLGLLMVPWELPSYIIHVYSDDYNSMLSHKL